MQIPIKIVNKKTNVIFENPNSNLLAYAKSDPSSFEITYEEVQGEVKERLSEEKLKEMNMKDLQTLAEGLECDKRRKDSLIDAILKAQGGK